MQFGRILKTTIAVGIAVNILDYLLHVLLLASWESNLAIMRNDASVAMLILGDFIAALVFVVVFDRVRSCFGPGAKGGATFGLYAGFLVNFPLWIFAYLLFNGMTYQAAWVFTLLGILWGVVAGATAGQFHGSDAPAAS